MWLVTSVCMYICAYYVAKYRSFGILQVKKCQEKTSCCFSFALRCHECDSQLPVHSRSSATPFLCLCLWAPSGSQDPGSDDRHVRRCGKPTPIWTLSTTQSTITVLSTHRVRVLFWKIRNLNLCVFIFNHILLYFLYLIFNYIFSFISFLITFIYSTQSQHYCLLIVGVCKHVRGDKLQYTS